MLTGLQYVLHPSIASVFERLSDHATVDGLRASLFASGTVAGWKEHFHFFHEAMV